MSGGGQLDAGQINEAMKQFSPGQNLQSAPVAAERDGLLQRQLQPGPALSQGPANAPSKMQGLLSSMQGGPGMEAIAQAPMSGGAGWQPINPMQDPALAATMQNLQGLLADSKQKKMEFAKAMMGGG